MIKITSSMVRIQGSQSEIYKEMAHLFMAFRENGLFNEKDLHEAVELAFLSDEEIEKRALERLDELKASLDEMLKSEDSKKATEDFFKKMFGDLEDK